MICPKCQTENPEAKKFCRKCGAKLTLACPQCSSECLLEDEFCGECGHSLIEPVYTGIDYSQPQSYTPKFLADKILTSRRAIEGERKLVTILFADVANYTSISEKIDPEEVHQIMDGCFKILMDEIHRYEGTIDKFTGDGVMALFGAPVAHEDHAQRACRAALTVQSAINDYGEKVKRDCGVEFKIRVGLNSGPVIVGSIGNDLRMDYTAIGDTTNLAARMQSTATPGNVLVAYDTYRLARDFFKFKPLGKVAVKGKEEAIDAYELIEPAEVETRIGAAEIKGLTRFVGRKREMATLKEAFEKAMGGTGQVVGVVGEAGVGKSRLLLEARKVLPQGTYTYLEGRCLHHGGSMPYLPFLDILRSYFDIKEGEREFIINKKIKERIIQLDETLTDILSPLQEMLSLKVEDEQFLRLDRQYKRGKTFEAVRNLLIRESQNRPLVIAVEDLHWIDNASQEFLTYLIGSLPSTAILLLLLYRPEYTHPWASKSNYSQVRVDQLSMGTSAELVQSILAGGDVSTELRELVLTRAGGNPFFVEEFIYSLLENGSIQRDNGHYVLTAKPSDIQVPDTVQGVISARMDRLDENLKRTMQVASVIGRDFAYSILETITGTQEELKSYLVDLQLLEFIYEKSLFPELEYIFKHALTQEVAYNSLLLKRRKKIHERIGEAIEILYPDRLEEFYEHLAFHYQKGESIDKAVDYLIKAGRKSFDRYALEEAHRFFIQAFEALLTKPERTRDDDLLLIDLVIEWAFVFYFRGDFRGLTDLLNANRELAESLDDRARYGMFLGWLGFTVFTRGYSKKSYELLKKALELGEEIGDQRVIGYTCTWLTHTYLDLGLFDEAIAIGERAQEIFRSLEADHYIYFKSLIGIGQTYFMRGDAIKTYATGEALLDFGQRHTSIRSIVVGHVTMSWIYYMDGDFAAAAECCTRAIEVSADPFFTMVARMMLGICQVMNGQFQEGEDTLQEALSHMLTFGYEYLAPLTRFCMGFAAIARGRVSEALDTAEGTLRSLLEGGRKNHAVIIQANLGKVYMLLEGVVPFASQKAEEHVNATIELAREIGARKTMGEAYLDLGLLHSSKGENEQARECVSKSVQLFEQCGLENWLKQAREALEALG